MKKEPTPKKSPHKVDIKIVNGMTNGPRPNFHDMSPTISERQEIKKASPYHSLAKFLLIVPDEELDINP